MGLLCQLSKLALAHVLVPRFAIDVFFLLHRLVRGLYIYLVTISVTMSVEQAGTCARSGPAFRYVVIPACYAHARAHARILILCMHARTHLHAHTHVHACYASMYACTHAYMHARMRYHACTHTHAHAHTHVHACYTSACACMHACTHAHTCTTSPNNLPAKTQLQTAIPQPETYYSAKETYYSAKETY